MTDEGRQTTPEGHINDQQQTEKVARDRAGTEKGLGAETVAKYVPGNNIQITETINNKLKRKKLYVAFSQKNAKGKTEYQLTETKDDTTKLYMNGKWFPQADVYPADVEQQAKPESPLGEDEDGENEDGPIFSPGGSGPYPTKVRTLEKCPNGYARLAAYNSSEQNFMLYRGFSNVHARLLLSLQCSIQMLEAELDNIDRFHDTLPNEASKKRLRSWDLDVAACRQEKEEAKQDGDEDEARTREDILEELRIKVNQYDELLIKARELVSFQRPTERDYRSVRNWFHNIAPLVDEEQDYILWKEDIVTLRHGREWAGFDGMVEALLHKMDGPLVQWLFRTEDQRRKSTDERNYYFAPSRVSTLVNLFITIALFLLLVAPVLAMYRLSTIKTTECVFAAIGILMVFTLLYVAAHEGEEA
ncbi:uncharacterized protein J4E78_000253 [Alternaria triticimaculans]|uniref:uncharacterized protein n=1 Tax=Alternaria triticimaculans TaxID=297637 RepID=UPI0020C525BE|nr:uncharacterized protein J4E78_000253 [Alternaria triticimaculans]KAI4671757.1 hypothetical protein J4E78_000253 [Alternaria triticimaculans]